MRISAGRIVVGIAVVVAVALIVGFVVEYLGLWSLQLPWSPYVVE